MEILVKIIDSDLDGIIDGLNIGLQLGGVGVAVLVFDVDFVRIGFAAMRG